MSKELYARVGVTGLTIYASVRNPADGTHWYTVTPAFEAFNAAHIATGYAIAMTEEGTTGDYYADFPAGIAAAGPYEADARKQVGGSPAWPADPVLSSGSIDWSGSALYVPTVPPSTTAIASAVWKDTNTDFAVNGSPGRIMTQLGGMFTTSSSSVFLSTVLPNLDATVSSRSTYAGGAVASVSSTVNANLLTIGGVTLTLPGSGNIAFPNAIASTTNVWDQATSGHTTGGTFGAAVVAAGGAGDPWSTALPGSYAAGTAGAILGQQGADDASAGLMFPVGTVLSASSPTVFTLTFAHVITAANFADWVLDFGAQLAGPSLGTIQSATQVDSTHLGITLVAPLSTTPTVGWIAALGPPPSIAADSSGRVILQPTGLDAILTTEPDTTGDGAVSTWNFRKLLRWGVMALARGSRTLSSGTGTLTVSKLAGSTSSTQTIADDGAGNETLGPPA